MAFFVGFSHHFVAPVPRCGVGGVGGVGGGGGAGRRGAGDGGEGGSFTFITSWESSQGSVWPLGMSHVCAPGDEYRFGGTSG